MISTNVVAVLLLCIHLLTLLYNLPALNKTMCPNQSPGFVSVTKESSSDTLACGNSSKGITLRRNTCFFVHG